MGRTRYKKFDRASRAVARDFKFKAFVLNAPKVATAPDDIAVLLRAGTGVGSAPVLEWVPRRV